MVWAYSYSIVKWTFAGYMVAVRSMYLREAKFSTFASLNCSKFHLLCSGIISGIYSPMGEFGFLGLFGRCDISVYELSFPLFIDNRVRSQFVFPSAVLAKLFNGTHAPLIEEASPLFKADLECGDSYEG